MPGQGLVVADGKGGGAGEFAQALAAFDDAAARGELEEAAGHVEHVDADAPAPRLVDDDPGIGVHVLGRVVADEQPFVDDVAALRSEEHTSELQSLMRISYAVFCLKKKPTYHVDHERDQHTHITI